jgi:Na+/glutamate symporter
MNLQLQELFIAYGVTALAMLCGLLIMRADARAYWRWPVYSAMAMVLGVVTWNLLRSHLLPPDWFVSRTPWLYDCALGLYALTGFALGLLLGRLTRGKTPGSDT